MGYYDENKPTCQVNILGTMYGVYTDISPDDDDYLDHCDGYCDKTVKRIVVAGQGDDAELSDYTEYAKTLAA